MTRWFACAMSIALMACVRDSNVGMSPALHPPSDAVAQCRAQCNAIGLSLGGLLLTNGDTACECAAPPEPPPPAAAPVVSPMPPASATP
ncbi:MAG TPA: hypothetical protein VGG74_02315 [Kofleriaceae bacterium]